MLLLIYFYQYIVFFIFGIECYMLDLYLLLRWFNTFMLCSAVLRCAVRAVRAVRAVLCVLC